MLKMFHVGLYTSQHQAGQRYASAPEMFCGFGVDQSSESHEAATQARTSLTSSGSMLLVTASAKRSEACFVKKTL